MISGTGIISRENIITHVNKKIAVVAYTLGSPRTDTLSNYVGFNFNCGSTAITITDLARWTINGNSQTHVVQLTDGTNILVSVNITTSDKTPDCFSWGRIQPYVLTPNSKYYIITDVIAGDSWSESSSVTGSSDIILNGSSYLNGNVYTDNGGGAQSYGPVNFKYY